MIEVESLKNSYTKGNFEFIKTEKTPYGERYIGRKKGKGIAGVITFTSNKWVLIEHIKKPLVSLEDLTSFVQNFENFVRKHQDDMNEVVAGHYLIQGDYDKKAFSYFIDRLPKDLKKRIKLKTIKAKGKVKEKELAVTQKKATLEEEHIREKVTEREITKRRVTIERIDIEEVSQTIMSIPFARQRKESGYEAQLYTALYSLGYPVEYESQKRGARFDLVLGKDELAIELKVVKGASVFDPLVGQIHRYRRQFRKIIIVLIDEFRNPSIMNREIDEIKKIDPENIKVIVK